MSLAILAVARVFLLVISYKTVTGTTASTFRLVSSGREPSLKLPGDLHFHCFRSHGEICACLCS